MKQTRIEIYPEDCKEEGDGDICPNCGEHSLKFYDDGAMECNNPSCLYAEDYKGKEYKTKLTK